MSVVSGSTLATLSALGAQESLLTRVIGALADCARACTVCADACLHDADVAELRGCIRLDLDCADLCAATERVLLRQSGYDATVMRAALEACVSACASCADECERHAGTHGHCGACAQACRDCIECCNELIGVIR